MSTRIPLRWNVLLLYMVAYASLLAIFGVLALMSGVPDAWDVIKEPLMALIGGTLAISKDLIAVVSTPADE